MSLIQCNHHQLQTLLQYLLTEATVEELTIRVGLTKITFNVTKRHPEIKYLYLYAYQIIRSTPNTYELHNQLHHTLTAVHLNHPSYDLQLEFSNQIKLQLLSTEPSSVIDTRWCITDGEPYLHGRISILHHTDTCELYIHEEQHASLLHIFV